MRATEALLASYLDLARHLDPLRYPDQSPPEIAHRLGQFDPASLKAHVSALRSIANALEDLDDVDALDDEVDRSMLLGSIRSDMLRLEGMIAGDASNPARALMHLNAALTALMGEDFDAECEVALRERVAASAAFLGSAREDTRPAPDMVVERARLLVAEFADVTLDMASERLDVASVEPALLAAHEHRRWLDEPARSGGEYGCGESHVEARLALLSPEPLGARGTLRLLELRRAGVERSLTSAATELGASDPLACARQLMMEAQQGSEVYADFWADEWRRVGATMTELGLPIPDGVPPNPPADAIDGWSMAAFAVRDHAARMLTAARAVNPRAVRRLLDAPGLAEAWGRTVAALLRSTAVFGLAERRVMTSYLALCESAAAEADLLLQIRTATPDELIARVEQVAGTPEADSRSIVEAATVAPLQSVAAALAHEAWQGWYAETGGEPVSFLLQALSAGGLAVPLARWALEAA